MKKLISLLLAMVMVFSLATVAFAEGEDTKVPCEEGSESCGDHACDVHFPKGDDGKCVDAACATCYPNYTDNVPASTSQTDVKLNKLFTITGAQNVAGTEADEIKAVYPHETLEFTVEGNAANPTTQMIEVADLAVGYIEASNTVGGTMAITLPAYTEVGKYIYTVSETAGNAQSATYATGEITLTVLVTYKADHSGLEAKLYLTQTNPTTNQTQTSEIEVDNKKVAKVDTFLNTYSVGQLDVTKTVTGNLASREEEFKMTVTFTSETGKLVKNDITVVDGSTTGEGKYATIPAGEGWSTKTHVINVKHGETVSFYNIPVGVTYTVEEDAQHLLAEGATFDPNSSDSTQYTVTYDSNKTGTIAASTVADGAEKATSSQTTVTNEKKTSVETGIALDSAPYFLMLAVALFGMVALVSKKRYEV